MFLQHFSPVCFIIIIAVAAALPLTVPQLLTIASSLVMKGRAATDDKGSPGVPDGNMSGVGSAPAHVREGAPAHLTEYPAKRMRTAQCCNYFDDLFKAIEEKTYLPTCNVGKVILFGGNMVQESFGTNHVVMHVRNYERTESGLDIEADVDWNTSIWVLDWTAPLFTLLVVRGDGMVLFNSYEYEIPKGLDFERGGFFDNREFYKNTVHQLSDINDRMMSMRTV